VFPKPRAGDPRKLVTQAVLGRDFSRLRNRRGKRLPSLPKLIRRTGRGADNVLAKALARGLARVDAARAGVSARAAQRSSDCGDQRVPRQRSNFTTGGGGGGPSASVGVELGPDGANLGIELSGNGMTIKADVDLGLCDPNEVEAPSCPTAVGKLEGQIRYKLKLAVQVSRGTEEVWSQSVDVTRRTKLTGWNEVDAKLDQLDVEDVETSNFRLGGSTRDHPPISIRTRLVRRTQVDMRSGAYDPGNSQMDVTIDMEGLYGPDRSDAEADAERRGRADADRQFRAVVEKAISGYRTREEGWQSPNTCAEARFAPPKNTLTLRANASGSFSTTVTATEGGGQSELDARLSEQQNAVFSPTRAGGQSAQFGYSGVAPATGPGQKVMAKVHATSKAGVAEDTWEQNMVPPFEINQISGNFAGSSSTPVGPRVARISWNGSGRFERATPPGFPGASGSYILKAGQATIHFSGGNILGHAICDMRGSAFVDLFQHGSGSIGVSPLDPARLFEQGPHNYSGSVGIGAGQSVTLTMENCIPEAASEEGKQYPFPIGGMVFDTGADERQSPDGIHYDGSWTQNQGGVTVEQSWTLIGERVPPG
jgi:hypothetical protein